MIEINGTAFTIIGVAPHEFSGMGLLDSGYLDPARVPATCDVIHAVFQTTRKSIG